MATVLVVEDEVDLCDIYKDALEAAGHTVHVASTGTQAVDSLIRRRIRPDVVILDMQLPGDSGLVVLGMIRSVQRLAKTKVIIASGHPDAGQWAVSQWGGDLFLQKPISLDVLKGTIDDFASGRTEKTDARSTPLPGARPTFVSRHPAPDGA